MFKVNNRNIRKRCGICWKLTMKCISEDPRSKNKLTHLTPFRPFRFLVFEVYFLIKNFLIKTKWNKDLITCYSHPWIMFPFNWLVIIWREGVPLTLDAQGQEDWRISDVDGQGLGALGNGQFSWTSYVYHPLRNYEILQWIVIISHK